MKEAIWRYLVNRIGSMKNLLVCRLADQTIGRILPGSALECSFHPMLQKAGQHASPIAHKSNTPRLTLIGRRLLLVLMSFCVSFLLTIAVQGMTTAPALAIAPPPPGGTGGLTPNQTDPGPNAYHAYFHGPCISFTTVEVPDEWKSQVCDGAPPFIRPSNGGSCDPNWIETMTATGQEECVLTVPPVRSECPVGFALDRGLCEYQPLDGADWQVGFCRSYKPYEVPREWDDAGVCNINPIPNPEQVFVRPANDRACDPNWVKTMDQTGQQQCVLTVPSVRSSCPIGFDLNKGRCQYQPQNRGDWQVGFCKSFTGDQIPPEWIVNRVCNTDPVPDPQQNFTKPLPCVRFSDDGQRCIRFGPCPQNWIPTTAESVQAECILTIPDVRSVCPIGFALDSGRCDYVPQGRTSWQAGFCKGFSSDEVPPAWMNNHICNVPTVDPESSFIQGVSCQQDWIETTGAEGQLECILTVPSVRGLCPIGFALDGAKCDYVPQSKVTWVVGLCKSFTSDEVPSEWMSNHVCDTNPVPDPEQTFIKDGPCVNNWIRTAAEGGPRPKCALTVPAIRGYCPIGFALDEASCNYVPRNPVGWQFPCSDRVDGKPNEGVIAGDWLSGDSPGTQSITSDATVTDGTTGGCFVHTFAGDTYGLQSVQDVFSYMLALAFMLVTPMVILIGYHLLLAASSFRHAGVLEGLSRVFLGALAVGVSFQLVTMLISFANVISSAIVDLHGMMGYPSTQIDGMRAAYTLVATPEPLTSYRGLVMPMSRWGCAVNDFIGILGNKFFSHQVTAWLPVIGNLAPLATQVTNGADLVSRLMEFARLMLSVVLWVQAVIRIGLLNCYILTCPVAFACWSFPGGLGRRVLRQWMKGFLAVLFIQVIQLFLMTTLPLILPSFPDLAGDQFGIMHILLTQLPPLLVLWLTVMVPNFVGIGASRAIGMTGLMAGGIVGAVGEAASHLA